MRTVAGYQSDSVFALPCQKLSIRTYISQQMSLTLLPRLPANAAVGEAVAYLRKAWQNF